MKRAWSPRALSDDEDDKRRAPRWGRAVRPSMVLLGFLVTLGFLALVFARLWWREAAATRSFP